MMTALWQALSKEVGGAYHDDRKARHFAVLVGVLALLAYLAIGLRSGEYLSVLLYVIFFSGVAGLVPALARPFLVVWIGFGTVLQFFLGKSLLVVLYYLLLTPAGLLKRLFVGSRPSLPTWQKISAVDPKVSMERLF